MNLMDRLAECGAQPFEKARSLPPELYADKGFLALEEAKIFGGEWICACRADLLKEPGDYVTLDILNQPIIVLRDLAGDIRALSNICRHRNMKILDGSGNRKRLSCPYHGWTYDLTGNLVGALHTDNICEETKNDCKLPQLQMTHWLGWIYVSLSQPQDLAPGLTTLEAELAPFNLAEMQTVFTVSDVWNCNWKLLVENFIESYHVFRVHKETIEPRTPTSSVVCVPGEQSFCMHYLTERAGARKLGQANMTVPKSHRDREVLCCVFPTHLISATANILTWLSLQPEGADHVRITGGISAAPTYLEASDNVDALKKQLRDDFDEFNREDRAIVESLQQSLKAPLATPGPLTKLERPVWEFNQYFAKKLASEDTQPF